MVFTFIDSHCHFDFDPFKNNEVSYLQMAKDKGVTTLVVPSVNQSNWDQVSRLAHQFDEIYYALGIHPLFITPSYERELENLGELLDGKNKKCVAIGECGLDFWHPESDMETQISVFRQHCLLAKQHQLPLIVHSRKSHDIVLKLLREVRPEKGGVIHGFSGSLQQANQFIELGFYIGVGGVISYERAKKTKMVISQLPLDKIILETDAPDMPLFGFQGEKNSPDKVRNVFEYLSLIRKESMQTISETVYKNTTSLFGI
ncbi:TatD family hydrolase [Aliivibrio fischeri]|uniref:TatD family hydrolase n=1 Tax=Aliivibrio fischeri TaxID=668 RepID=UPI0007C5B55A|nr:TatD family hydrolase [Aliivibrio fischeri]MUJ22373.1 YchF/TatD family DNA exonuclease [Aliivibrio fischeri]